MLPYYYEIYANASSSHKFGKLANQAVNKSREHIADLLHCNVNEIIFTSGATESINIALRGICSAFKDKGNHIITVVTEHNAVLDTCKYLESIGIDVTYLPVKKDGLIDVGLLKEYIRKGTILVSIMHVNNETGVIQPIEEISNILKDRNIFFMSDTTQSIGKIPVNVKELGIDIAVLSAHKFYGPKGIGGLYIKNNLKVEPLIFGGGQEKSIRSGTLNVPLIVGLGKASELAKNDMETDCEKISLLKTKLEDELLKLDGTFINGNISERLCNITNICFSKNDITKILLGIDNLIVSNGSACSSATIQPSHVLTEMGLSVKEANSSIRFSLGKFNTLDDIEEAINILMNNIHLDMKF
jgi:cysteine desulfurase